MDPPELLNLAQTLVCIKQQLKCPICLDVIQETLELQCGHRYCKECFLNTKSHTNLCSICKQTINRRSFKFKDVYGDKIGAYIQNVCEVIKNQYCEVERLKTMEVVENVYRKTLPSTSKGVPEPLPYEAFDKLTGIKLNELTVNKSGNQRVYKNFNKSKNECKYEDKIINFNEVETKENVIQWLSDNKNKFNRLTQTQQVLDDSEEELIFDFNSVTQNLPAKSSKDKQRARSLDNHFKKATCVPNLQRHSLNGKLAMENYEIEEINTEEEDTNFVEPEKKIVMELIEDEYLNRLDNEINNEKSAEKKKKCKKLNEDDSGWSRLKNISKSIKKKRNAKVPKQLLVHLDNLSTERDKGNDRSKEEEINLTVVQKNPASNDVKEAKENCTKSKNPNRTTSVFSNSQIDQSIFINPTQKLNVSDSSTNKPEVIDSTNINVVENDCFIVDNDLEDDFDVYSRPTQKTPENLDEDDDKSLSLPRIAATLNKSQATGEEIASFLKSSLESCISSLEKNETSSKSLIKYLNDLVPYADKLEKMFNSKISNSTVNTCNARTQTVNTLMLSKNVQTMVRSDFLNVFNTGVQTEEMPSCNCAKTNSKKDQPNVNEDDIFQGSFPDINFETEERGKRKRLEHNVDKIVKVQPATSRKKDHLLQDHVTNDNELIIDKEQPIINEVAGKEDDIFPGSFPNINFETQELIKRSKLMQNVDKVVKVQAATSKKSFNVIILDQKQPNVAEVASKEDDIFPGSFPNINFETQELEKRSRLLHNSVNKIIELEAGTSRKTTSLEEDAINISLGSAEPIRNKNVNRKLFNRDTESKKTFKRIRTISSGSDSEDEANCKKKSRNRFVKNNLSVQFETQTNTEKLVDKDLLDNDSDVDYDAYLKQALKKFDEYDSQNSKKEISPKEANDVIMACDDLIKNATKMPQKNNIKTQIDNKENKIDNPLSDDAFSFGDNVFLDENNISKIEKDLEEFEKQTHKTCHSEISDVISETEQFVPIKVKRTKKIQNENKFSESLIVGSDDKSQRSMCLFAHSETQKYNKRARTKSVDTKSGDNDEVVQVLDDSFEEDQGLKRKKCDINVLQNIILQSPNRVDEGEETFMSDEDVVETTPQKEKIPCSGHQRSISSSQLCANITQFIVPPENMPTSQFIEPPENMLTSQFIVPPPPGFEDNTQHSQPLQHSETPFNISPIAKEKSLNMGVVDVAQSSKFSPLVIMKKSQNSKRNLLTSTPKQKSIWNYVKSSSQNQSSGKKPCIACSRLNKDQIIAISGLSNKKLATYSASFGPEVTHMIVATNEENCVRDHTIKYVYAVASGIWVLRFQWVQDCLINSCIMPEESYEVLDVSGVPGPKTSRLTRLSNPLLKGFKFNCAEPFLTTTREEIEEVIKLLGGKVVPTLEQLTKKDGSICIIITEIKATQDYEVYENWLEIYKIITVDIEWLCRCIGQYKLLSVQPHALCCYNSISDLGYPPELVAEVPLTFSDNSNL